MGLGIWCSPVFSGSMMIEKIIFVGGDQIPSLPNHPKHHSTYTVSDRFALFETILHQRSTSAKSKFHEKLKLQKINFRLQKE